MSDPTNMDTNFIKVTTHPTKSGRKYRNAITGRLIAEVRVDSNGKYYLTDERETILKQFISLEQGVEFAEHRIKNACKILGCEAEFIRL